MAPKTSQYGCSQRLLQVVTLQREMAALWLLVDQDTGQEQSDLQQQVTYCYLRVCKRLDALRLQPLQPELQVSPLTLQPGS